jgi:Na+/H+ antiporter NhaA
VATENASAVVLLAATVTAMVWANSPWAASYEELWHTTLSLRLGADELSLDLRHWVNDGLMAFFFFVVGLEVKRDLVVGELGHIAEATRSRIRRQKLGIGGRGVASEGARDHRALDWACAAAGRGRVRRRA